VLLVLVQPGPHASLQQSLAQQQALVAASGLKVREEDSVGQE
jgi:hypothetical protein